ncbi:MAG: DUF1761 domain-containing protein [Rhizobiaceae bacterium]
MKHNHVAIALLVIAHLALGFLWYSPFLFLEPWAAGFRLNLAAMAAPNPLAFVFIVLGAVVSSYVLSWLILRLDIAGFGGAVMLALALWAGPVFAALAPHYLFGQVGIPALAIDLANVLVALVISTVVLALWRRGPG